VNFELGAEADNLRSRPRDIVAQDILLDFLGGFSGHQADLNTAERFAPLLAEMQVLTPSWPREYGGQDVSAWVTTILREEMWAHDEPSGARYMGQDYWGYSHAATAAAGSIDIRPGIAAYPDGPRRSAPVRSGSPSTFRPRVRADRGAARYHGQRAGKP
jgi:alkylation response protein AidB-like acyl-CoA dehydrogenase